MKWKYMTITCAGEDIDAATSASKRKLEEYAKDKWELVSATSAQGAGQAAVVLFLKKKVSASVKRLLLSVDFPGMLKQVGFGPGTRLNAVTSFGVVSGDLVGESAEGDGTLPVIEQVLEGAFGKSDEFKDLALEHDVIPLKDVSITTSTGNTVNCKELWLDPEMVIGFMYGDRPTRTT